MAAAAARGNTVSQCVGTRLRSGQRASAEKESAHQAESESVRMSRYDK